MNFNICENIWWRKTDKNNISVKIKLIIKNSNLNSHTNRDVFVIL
jgi:hypothetical protein